LIAVAGLAFLTASCHDTPETAMAPVTTMPADPLQAQVPKITILSATTRDGMFVIKGLLEDRDPAVRTFYDASHAGGWMLQVFLNTDQIDTTGYWKGYDYIVRGEEGLPAARTMITRRITLEPQYPGGWGPMSGQAGYGFRGQILDLWVPLQSIGDDDGMLDFALETYAVEPCAECQGGVTEAFEDDYFGSTGGAPGATALAARAGSMVPSGRRAPRPGHSTDADPALGFR
jgi:hypothetical protein